MFKIKVKVLKGKDVQRKLENVRKQLRNRYKPLTEVKRYINDRWVLNYEQRGRIYGLWKDLSDYSWRREGDPPYAPPLIHKGHMFADVQAQNEAGRVRQKEVRWKFINRPPNYPLSHQFGWNPFYDQPERIIWRVNDEDEEKTEDILRDWVRTIISRYY